MMFSMGMSASISGSSSPVVLSHGNTSAVWCLIPAEFPPSNLKLESLRRQRASFLLSPLDLKSTSGHHVQYGQ